MIKRNGQEIKPSHHVNNQILKILNDGEYNYQGKIINIAETLNNAILGSILYKDIPDKEIIKTKVKLEVTNESTIQAANRLLVNNKDIVILNFASACNPGGGFLAGAIAQEEDLCRASGLYPCLKNKPMFYNDNIKCGNHYYTDGIIYSPNVPFIMDGDGFVEPYLLSVISCPAPNVRLMDNVDEEYLYNLILGRIEKILKVAYLHNHKTIILGAWGCGAFGNDIKKVANAFKIVLNKMPVFENVCFALLGRSTNDLESRLGEIIFS